MYETLMPELLSVRAWYTYHTHKVVNQSNTLENPIA